MKFGSHDGTLTTPTLAFLSLTFSYQTTELHYLSPGFLTLSLTSHTLNWTAEHLTYTHPHVSSLCKYSSCCKKVPDYDSLFSLLSACLSGCFWYHHPADGPTADMASHSVHVTVHEGQATMIKLPQLHVPQATWHTPVHIMRRVHVSHGSGWHNDPTPPPSYPETFGL